MAVFLRGLNRALRRFRRICQVLLLICIGAFSAMILAGIVMERNHARWQGIDAVRPVLQYTGQLDWPAAFGFIAFAVGTGAFAAILLLMVAQFVLRWGLLLHSTPGIAQVVRLRQTGASVNQRPVMTIWLRVDGAISPHLVSVNKLIDLGTMPRPGDRVRVAISRIDPTCVDFLGALHP